MDEVIAHNSGGLPYGKFDLSYKNLSLWYLQRIEIIVEDIFEIWRIYKYFGKNSTTRCDVKETSSRLRDKDCKMRKS